MQDVKELLVQKYTAWLNETNMYIVIDRDTNHVLLIDPADKTAADRIMEEEQAELDYILLTHEHYDHIAALNELRESYRSEVIASQMCSDRIQDPKTNMSRYFNVVMEFTEGSEAWQTRGCCIKPYYTKSADVVFSNKKEFNWCGHSIALYEAPGHSPGSILIDIDNKYLFSGDTISYDYELITRFPGGSRKEYQRVTHSLLSNFEKSRQVYPGHGRMFRFEEISVF